MSGMAICHHHYHYSKDDPCPTCELEELLSTLLYWHERDHIDESWWDEVREVLKRSRLA